MDILPTSAAEISAFGIEKTSKLLKLSFSRVLASEADVDVTVDQWVVLHLLYTNGPLSQITICQETTKDAPTITRIIDILSKKKYVQRSTNIEDRRQFIIGLTGEGEAMVQRILPLVRDFRSKAFNNIPTHELHSLQHTLSIIESNISN